MICFWAPLASLDLTEAVPVNITAILRWEHRKAVHFTCVTAQKPYWVINNRAMRCFRSDILSDFKGSSVCHDCTYLKSSPSTVQSFMTDISIRRTPLKRTPGVGPCRFSYFSQPLYTTDTSLKWTPGVGPYPFFAPSMQLTLWGKTDTSFKQTLSVVFNCVKIRSVLSIVARFYCIRSIFWSADGRVWQNEKGEIPVGAVYLERYDRATRWQRKLTRWTPFEFFVNIFSAWLAT